MAAMPQPVPKWAIALAAASPPRLGKRGQTLASLNGVLKNHLRHRADGRKVATLADG
ncbi:hypothetical protein BN873_490089 [Candidatus Competibacter denitrificans Run_A_D11]|uniref:Uncharacterized protein n=1 Tax=Candidatus Competibacter denitrificans Run_A_D11 TaxID=1400863 RepID=W6MBG3_9GAMM|nr:hypothetical protein BN873_490089 [Candidatus Competibacter denitrificans Run_A_D11]